MALTTRTLGMVAAAAVSLPSQGGGSPSYIMLVVQAESEEGTGYFFVTLDDFFWGKCDYGRVVLANGLGLPIGFIDHLCFHFELDPASIEIDFDVRAGSNPTEFTITSGLITFDPDCPADGARAEAVVTLTDLSGDGAALGGLNKGGGIFAGLYGAGTFVELIGALKAEPFWTVAQADSFPQGPGFAPVDAAPSMQMRFAFSLTPEDRVTAAAQYQIIRSCTGDVALDGAVDVLDLVEVILHWGEPGGDADVTEDGVVDAQDLVAVLLAWGPCEHCDPFG